METRPVAAKKSGNNDKDTTLKISFVRIGSPRTHSRPKTVSEWPCFRTY